MVIGMDLLIEHFQSHTNQYILIGGAACDRHFEKVGLPFRATKEDRYPQFNQRGSQNLYSNCIARTARRKKIVEKPWRWGKLFGRHF